MSMTKAAARTPKEITKEAHREYYAAGEYADDRYCWTIETFLPSCQGKRILEVGCGGGKLLELLKPVNDVVGVDASVDGIAACDARGIEGHCIDTSSEPLPFADESFDLVICLETIEHMMNPYYALMEMRRVLRRGGRLVCSVPNHSRGALAVGAARNDFAKFPSWSGAAPKPVCGRVVAEDSRLGLAGRRPLSSFLL